jgi:acyl-CoA synthetase (AMP-forming)/AMP-acid ligase II
MNRLPGATLTETLAAVAPAAAGIDFPLEKTRLPLTELVAAADSVAAGLAGLGVGPGDRVGVLCANEPDFLRALFGVLRSGAAVCPLPLPTTARELEAYLGRLAGIVEVAGLRHVIVSGKLGALEPALAAHLGVELWHVAALHGTGARPDLPDPADTAIVQFTSGSTAAPKGVALTHGAVLAGLEAIVRGADMRADRDRGNVWLPLYHDMGLFGTLSGALVGMPVTLWSPAHFIKHPDRWLATVARERHTICPLPNFAYDALVDAVPAAEMAGLDLSAWRVAFNGAEMISVESVEAFLAHAAPAGFRPEVMLPVYGLAEATLAVTFPPLGRAPVADWVDREALAGTGRAVPVERGTAGARGVVGLGRAVHGMSVRIAGADGPGGGAAGDRSAGGWTVGDREVGEVQVRGASVTTGYLAAPGDRTELFTADGWLRTGDLGYLAAGELHLTGRIKDMMIVRGANYYPEDVESAARAETGVYKRRCVAFVTTEPERMVLVAETTVDDADERRRLAAGLRGRVGAATGLGELEVHLLPPRSIPRTSSGKLRRQATRELVAPPVPAGH